jgi:predicted AAA+ superfamily ATPase
MTGNNGTGKSNYITRNIEGLALATIADTPVTVIQGARQVGKSTLASMLAVGLNGRQVTFDNETTLQAAREDPISFTEQHPGGTLIIDEAQLFPKILRSIKLAVDADRRPGRFIITGSADLLHITGANESLAGRAETIHLFPFSQGELKGYKEDFVKAVTSADPLNAFTQAAPEKREGYAEAVSKGGYPEAVAREHRRRRAFFRNYLTGVLDHDAVSISGLAHLDKLTQLFSLLAAQASCELVKANLAKRVGIPETSIHAYIRLLRDLCLVEELPAWGRNLTKRAISRTKLIINDTGLACFLDGQRPESLTDLSHGEIFGRMLENLAISELLKQQAWSESDYSLHHFRDKDQREIDIVIELFDGRIIALEVKATQTVLKKHFNGLRYLRNLLGERFDSGIVLYTGQDSLSFGDRLYALPFSLLWGKPK